MVDDNSSSGEQFDISPDVKLTDEQRTYLRKATYNICNFKRKRPRSSDSSLKVRDIADEFLGFADSEIVVTMESVKANLNDKLLHTLEDLCYKFTRSVVNAQRNLELGSIQKMFNLKR